MYSSMLICSGLNLSLKASTYDWAIVIRIASKVTSVLSEPTRKNVIGLMIPQIQEVRLILLN